MMEIAARLPSKTFDQQRHRLSRAVFQRMADVGIFNEDDRIELIEGELIDMSPIGAEHAGTVAQLVNMLQPAEAVLYIQSPLVIDDHTEPEPDLMLLRARDDFYKRGKPRPSDVLLLIEVADSSLDYDRTIKLPLYARFRIPEVWLINLRDRVVEVYCDPDGSTYQQTRLATSGDTLHPGPARDIEISAAALFA